MKSPTLLLVFSLFISVSSAIASDNYLIAVPNNGIQTQSAIKGFVGYYWGTTIDKVFLNGGERELAWLDNYNITYQAFSFNDETSTLFLCYIRSQNDVTYPAETIFSGPGYVITRSPIGRASFCRRLNLRAMPPDGISDPGESILSYSSRIDTLIHHVNQDSIVSYLNKLSGNSPIQINGGIDTIHTRYSYVPDNILAAQYLKETLERYGYQTAYHKFYKGTGRHVAAYGPNKAWFVSEGSEAFRTIDGGANWVLMPDNTANALWGVENSGPDSVWISGNIGTIKFSSDGGQTFTPQRANTNGFLFGINFINNTTGWIAADTGLVLHTTNSGANWTRQTTPSLSRFYDVCFVDSSYGWAVGQDGTIVHTTDGGTNWSEQISNSLQRLYGVAFTNRNVGWVVGWEGMVLHTTDGGENWAAVNLWLNTRLYHVAFTDSLHGCIIGWGGKVFTTTDGGLNWNAMPAQLNWNFYGVTFSDSLTGYAVGDLTVTKTTDGGVTWFNQAGGVETSWRNVVATKLGTTEPNQQVIICGHFDDTSELPLNQAPGSDDNGSGTTGVIEAARVLAQRDFKKTVKFCLWTGEEQGLFGSAQYAADVAARGDSIMGVFNYDMIAFDGNNDNSIELHCGTMPSSLTLGNLFQGVVNDYGLTLSPEILTWNSTDRSDHASFWDNNYPAMLGIEDFGGDFNPYYHTTNDNMTHIDTLLFTNYVKAATASVATLAIIDTTSESVPENREIPDAFALHQNYPNPFNAETLISFSLTAQSNINLSIYDLLGRKVATLLSGPLDAGTHSVTWNAGKFASGVYLCRLQSGDMSVSTRMLLLK